jgi:hypothetical protein
MQRVLLGGTVDTDTALLGSSDVPSQIKRNRLAWQSFKENTAVTESLSDFFRKSIGS